jgi:hypothetical protein
MRDRWFEQERHGALAEGAIWDRKHGHHEATVEIVKCVKSRIGERYLVQGSKSGRQWCVGHATLLNAYEPRKTAPSLNPDRMPRKG